MKAKRLKRWVRRLAWVTLVSLLGCVLAFEVTSACLPFPLERLERQPISAVVTAADGRMLLAVVGPDDQWRQPVPIDRMSPWLIKATIAVEDERFYSHVGVDSVAVVRAVGQNIAAGRVQSGASTLTMQVCRMMDDRPRTLKAKAIESFRALQLERLMSKDELLETYLNLAPYGGNLRGVEAASRRYFGKPVNELSLGEAALLAGLPQSPSRYRPDRYPNRAQDRRENVLLRMHELGMITAGQYESARSEPVVCRSSLHETLAPHAAWFALAQRDRGGQLAIEPALQRRFAAIARQHADALPAGADVAVVAIEIETGAVRAMIGSAHPEHPWHGQVNSATAWRSPGSTLKPFVYAAAFDAGRLNADAWVYDVPIQRAGWRPNNFDRAYRGRVDVRQALQESLNVPAILATQQVGLNRCVGLMQACGVRFRLDAQAAGLAAVTGAAEVRLIDLTNAYATLGRGGVRMPWRLFADEPTVRHRVLRSQVCDALDAILSSHARRPHGLEDIAAADTPWFVWKTGTSSARRDAWAVGHNGRYAIGVWVGRSDGGAHEAFVGRKAAEPLLARLFVEGMVRNERIPQTPAPLRVDRPLPPPREWQGELAILNPSREAVYVAVSGEVVVRPRVQADGDDLTWFLNGRRVESADRLTLGRGVYNLRVVDRAGQHDAVRFRVR